MRNVGRFNGYFIDYFHYESKPPCFIMTTCAPNIINDCSCSACMYSLDVTEYLFLYNRRRGNVDEDDRVLCSPIIFPCLKENPRYLDYYTLRELEMAALVLVNVEFEFVKKYLYFCQRYPQEFYKAIDARIMCGEDHCSSMNPMDCRTYYCMDCDKKYCDGYKSDSNKVKTVTIEESCLLQMSVYYQLSCKTQSEVEEIHSKSVEIDVNTNLLEEIDYLDIDIIEDLINGKFPEIFKRLLLKFQNLIREYMRVRKWFKPIKDDKGNILKILLKDYCIGRGVKKKYKRQCKF